MARPTIQLQLYRNGLPLGPPVTLVDGVLEYLWKGLPKFDENGQAYVYTVDEVDVPEGYIKTISEDGLTVINTLIEKISVVGQKVWVGGDPTSRPPIQLQLFRNGEVFGAPVQLNGALTNTWTELYALDDEGKPYIYTVDEVSVPEGYEKSHSLDRLSVINTFIEPEEDPELKVDNEFELMYVLRWEGNSSTDVDFHMYLDKDIHLYYISRRFDEDTNNFALLNRDHVGSHAGDPDARETKPEIFTVMGLHDRVVNIMVTNFNGGDLIEDVTVEVFKSTPNGKELISMVTIPPEMISGQKTVYVGFTKDLEWTKDLQSVSYSSANPSTDLCRTY